MVRDSGGNRQSDGGRASNGVGLAGDDPFLGPDGGGRVLIGVTIYSGSTRLAELAARCGCDAVWIEMEHGPAGFSEAEAVCVAVEAGGGIPCVRVADAQRTHVLRALEIGARIVVVPMVNTAQEAERIVEHGKFPPLGYRGYNTRSRGTGYGLDGFAELTARANARSHLFAQIETLEAVDNLAAICGVRGLSGVFVGPGDLSVSLGCPGELNSPTMVSVVADCVRKARAAGKHAGILVAPGALLDAALAAGCDLAFCGGDVMDLANGWQKLATTIQSKACS